MNKKMKTSILAISLGLFLSEQTFAEEYSGLLLNGKNVRVTDQGKLILSGRGFVYNAQTSTLQKDDYSVTVKRENGKLSQIIESFQDEDNQIENINLFKFSDSGKNLISKTNCASKKGMYLSCNIMSQRVCGVLIKNAKEIFGNNGGNWQEEFSQSSAVALRCTNQVTKLSELYKKIRPILNSEEESFQKNDKDALVEKIGQKPSSFFYYSPLQPAKVEGSLSTVTGTYNMYENCKRLTPYFDTSKELRTNHHHAVNPSASDENEIVTTAN